MEQNDDNVDDETTKSTVCKYGVRMVMDLVVVSFLLYLVVEAVKKVKSYRHVDTSEIPAAKKHPIWQDIVALFVCFVFLFVFAFELAASCLGFVARLFRSQKIEPLERHDAQRVYQA